ncbi:unnamed protein product [Adineta steineri]|uniref:G-protein coupled receptors family 1 profile domain-containing protein n=1 Tax=Adineta steineri TaxID=433720 RepID=A0A814DKJ8_9BILA|nr:unnamed protein product [Adineta steineri]CAF0956049.1 unnamed protein product [Adineta steineri]CAF0961050.1 unnamed protein product [Adineta steineri]
MNSHDVNNRLSQIPLINKSILHSLNTTLHPREQISHVQSLLIIFETVRISSAICSVLGVLANLALIYVIANTSFRHVSYGLLIATIAFFDSIRLLSSIFYYLIFANVIPRNFITKIIYVVIDRYPIFVVNWCKVLMSIERLLTVRYWEHHTHLDWRSKHKRKQHRQFTYAIIFILISGFISQHPNFFSQRYEFIDINYQRLMFVIKQNPNFKYGYYKFNNTLFTIISYLILDTTMPVFSVLFVNILLLKEIRRLPLSLQVKVKESIGILFFLTGLSIAILPRAFIALYGHYVLDDDYTLLKKLSISFYICLGFEYFNHAITGYTCFLQSALLRSELKNMIWTRYIVHHLHE